MPSAGGERNDVISARQSQQGRIWHMEGTERDSDYTEEWMAKGNEEIDAWRQGNIAM